jgi:hypothetical protein
MLAAGALRTDASWLCSVTIPRRLRPTRFCVGERGFVVVLFQADLPDRGFGSLGVEDEGKGAGPAYDAVAWYHPVHDQAGDSEGGAAVSVQVQCSGSGLWAR